MFNDKYNYVRQSGAFYNEKQKEKKSNPAILMEKILESFLRAP